MSNNGNDHNSIGVWRTQPMYTFSEVAHLAHISVGTVRNWLFGYTVKGREVSPLIKGTESQEGLCSFLQLVEIVVAAQFRKAEHKPFAVVRRAHENAVQLSQLEYPFAHLRLEALGGHIVHIIRRGQPGSSVQALDEPSQWTLPGLVLDVIHSLDYEQDLAAKWYPQGKSVPIVIDPRISSGIPVVIGTGVSVHVIRARFQAGQSMDFIAQDFAIKRDVVEEVFRYAERIGA